MKRLIPWLAALAGAATPGCGGCDFDGPGGDDEPAAAEVLVWRLETRPFDALAGLTGEPGSVSNDPSGGFHYRDDTRAPEAGEPIADDLAVATAIEFLERTELLPSTVDGCDDLERCAGWDIDVALRTDRVVNPPSPEPATTDEPPLRPEDLVRANDVVIRLTPRLPITEGGAPVPVIGAHIDVAVARDGRVVAVDDNWREVAPEPIAAPLRPRDHAEDELIAQGLPPAEATGAVLGYRLPGEHHGTSSKVGFYYPEYLLIDDRAGPEGYLAAIPATGFMPRLGALGVPGIIRGDTSTWSVDILPDTGRPPVTVRWSVKPNSGGDYRVLGEGTSIDASLPEGDYQIRVEVGDASGDHYQFAIPAVVVDSAAPEIAGPDGPAEPDPAATATFDCAPSFAGGGDFQICGAVCAGDLELGLGSSDCSNNAVYGYLYDRRRRRMLASRAGTNYFRYRLDVSYRGQSYQIRSDTCALSPTAVGKSAPGVCAFPRGPFARMTTPAGPRRAAGGFETRRVIDNLPGTLELSQRHAIDEQIYAGETLPLRTLSVFGLSTTNNPGHFPDYDRAAQLRLIDIGEPKPGVRVDTAWHYQPPDNPHCSELKDFCQRAAQFRSSHVSWRAPYSESGEAAPPVHCPDALVEALEQHCPDGAPDVPDCRYAVQRIHLTGYSILVPFHYREGAASVLTQEVMETEIRTARFDDVAGDLRKRLLARVGPTAGPVGYLSRPLAPGANGTLFHFIEPIPRETIQVPRTKSPSGAFTASGWSNLHLKDLRGEQLWPQVPGCQTTWRLRKGPRGLTAGRWIYDRQDCVHYHETWWRLRGYNTVNRRIGEEYKWMIAAYRPRPPDKVAESNEIRPGRWINSEGIAATGMSADVSTSWNYDDGLPPTGWGAPNVPIVTEASPLSVYTLQTQIRTVTARGAGDRMFRAPIFVSIY